MKLLRRLNTVAPTMKKTLIAKWKEMLRSRKMVELNLIKCNTSTRRPANVNWAQKRKHAALRLPKMSLLKVETTVMSYLRQNLTWSY